MPFAPGSTRHGEAVAKPEHFIALKMASDCELSLYTFRGRQNDGAWIDQTGAEILPLKSLFRYDLALFGDAEPGQERTLPPLPPGPKP